MSGLTSYTTNKLIDFLFRGVAFVPPTDLYFALMRTDPEGGNEVSGGSYSRAHAAASLANFAGTQASGSDTESSGTSGQTSNNFTLTYPGPTAAWGTIGKVWVYDAPTGGNCIAKGNLPVPRSIGAGDAPPVFVPSAFIFIFTNGA